MRSLIDELRNPQCKTNFTYPSDYVEHIDELRFRAAGGLIETAAAISLIQKLLLDGNAPEDSLIQDLLISARESLHAGGDVVNVLQLTPEELRPGSMPERLARFYGAQAAYTPQLLSHQTSECLAAATKISEIDNAISALRNPTLTISSKTFSDCLKATEARCWALPARLPSVPSVTEAA